MKPFLVILMLGYASHCYAQLNCDAYQYADETDCYEACRKALVATKLQGSMMSQRLFDEAIALCPSFTYAYFEKAVPYLKRGLFIEWRRLIDQAVHLDPVGYLGYRGWCRFQFMRDYSGALEDLDALDSLTQGKLGYSQNGTYHLNVVRALCHRGGGNLSRAIAMIEEQLVEGDYSAGPYDYLHLGVMKMESGDVNGALVALEKQLLYNPYVAENHYYLARAMMAVSRVEEAKTHLQQARSLYEEGYRMQDPYTHPVDKVFMTDIDSAAALRR